MTQICLLFSLRPQKGRKPRSGDSGLRFPAVHAGIAHFLGAAEPTEHRGSEVVSGAPTPGNVVAASRDQRERGPADPSNPTSTPSFPTSVTWLHVRRSSTWHCRASASVEARCGMLMPRFVKRTKTASSAIDGSVQRQREGLPMNEPERRRCRAARSGYWQG